MYLLSDEFANGAETIRVKEEEQGDELGEEVEVFGESLRQSWHNDSRMEGSGWPTWRCSQDMGAFRGKSLPWTLLFRS